MKFNPPLLGNSMSMGDFQSYDGSAALLFHYTMIKKGEK